MLEPLIIAFSMYSALPMPQIAWNERNMRHALSFFPLVGVVIGGGLWLWLWGAAQLALAPALGAAVASALPVLLSGGIHLDGFCDTVDALASHASAERKLEILKDPHIGAFALIGCVLYLLLAFGLWSQYRFSPQTAGVLALGMVFSRGLSGSSVVLLRCAKPDGLAALFSKAADRAATAAATLLWAAAAAIGMLALSGVSGAAAIVAGLLVFGYYRFSAYRQFGGVTGDLAGYFLQLCELLLLAAVVATGGGIGS